MRIECTQRFPAGTPEAEAAWQRIRRMVGDRLAEAAIKQVRPGLLNVSGGGAKE